MIVGRTEDYVTASHPSLVATPRGVQRWGRADETKRHQPISWTVKHYRFKSLIAPSDVYFDFDDHNFAEGQPLRLVKRTDLYAQPGWSGDVIPHLVGIDGDIYDQSIE